MIIEEYDKSLKGKKFGLLTVTNVFRKNKKIYAHVVCDCGNEKDIRVLYLHQGTKSCGCLYQKNRYPGQTLCWSCTRTDCSWMQNFKPVDGWEAVKTVYKGVFELLDSYIVKKCPLYNENTRWK